VRALALLTSSVSFIGHRRWLANGEADQRRAIDLATPLESIRRLIQRLVRRFHVSLHETISRIETPMP